jgi:drug/metabolite transporter (DMT)-like permease
MDLAGRDRGRTLKHAPRGVVIAALFFLMFIWGGSFIAIKIALRSLNPAELVIARFVPSALMLLPIGWWAARRSRRHATSYWKNLTPKERWQVVIASFLGVPAYHFCLNYGETLIPAGWASLVISLNPACIVLFAAYLLHEPVGTRRWLGIGLAFAGLLFIAFTHDVPAEGGQTQPMLRTAFGLFVTLGAVVSWGGFTILSKKLIAGREPLEGLGWIMTLGALWGVLAWPPGLVSIFSKLTPDLIWSVIFLSVGCTVIGFIIWFWALAQWPASQAGAYIYLVPLFALGISRWILAEPLGLHTLLGAAGVLGGVVLAASTPVAKGDKSVA